MLHPPKRFDPLRDSRIVGRHDECHRVPPHIVENHGKRRLTCALIELAGRLVGQQQSGTMDERPRDPDALRLPAGQFVRQPIRETGEIEGCERIADCVVVRGAATQAERQRHVLGDGERRYQGRELMDHSNRERTQRLTGTDTRPGNRSARGFVESRDQIEQRRLPAPRRTQQRDALAASNGKRRRFERDDFGVAGPKLRAQGLQP